MGVSGVSIGATNVAYRSSLPSIPASSSNRVKSETLQTTNSSPSLFGQPPKTDSAVIGFGNGTVSTATAVLHTVHKTVEAARSVVESLAEVRARISEVSPKAEAKSSNAIAPQDKLTIGSTQSIPIPESTAKRDESAKANASPRAASLGQTATTVPGAAVGKTSSTPDNNTPQDRLPVGAQTVSDSLAPSASHINLLA
jgi:hypothetical protein